LTGIKLQRLVSVRNRRSVSLYSKTTKVLGYVSEMLSPVSHARPGVIMRWVVLLGSVQFIPYPSTPSTSQPSTIVLRHFTVF